MAEVTVHRAGEMLRGLLGILSHEPDGLPVKEVLARLAKAVPPTPFEAADYPNRPGVRRYENYVRFHSISTVKAGWLVKAEGTWFLTDLGKQALTAFPDPADFYREAWRLYNEWLADFCSSRPDRFAGLASIPNNPIEAAIDEVERVAKRGAVRGLDIANSPDLKPLWDPYWNPLWEVINDVGLPLHFHTVGGYVPEHIRKIQMIGSDPTRAELPGAPEVEISTARAAFASHITQFQVNMANVLTSIIYAGILER